MPISVSCKCGKRFKARDEYAGRHTKCPSCGEPLTIPTETPIDAVLVDDQSERDTASCHTRRIPQLHQAGAIPQPAGNLRDDADLTLEFVRLLSTIAWPVLIVLFVYLEILNSMASIEARKAPPEFRMLPNGNFAVLEPRPAVPRDWISMLGIAQIVPMAMLIYSSHKLRNRRRDRSHARAHALSCEGANVRTCTRCTGTGLRPLLGRHIGPYFFDRRCLFCQGNGYLVFRGDVGRSPPVRMSLCPGSGYSAILCLVALIASCVPVIGFAIATFALINVRGTLKKVGNNPEKYYGWGEAMTALGIGTISILFNLMASVPPTKLAKE